MGTWGPGNLENDYAMDELADRSAKLVKTLLERVSRKTSREFDEYDHTTLFVEFEIVFALDAKGLLTTNLPSPEEVDGIKKDFVKDWLKYYLEGSGATADHTAKRKRVIMDTFSRFKRICKKHQ